MRGGAIAEYGGDGIAFVMTSLPDQNQIAGSGIGYADMKNCFAIELDSYYNGSAESSFNNQVITDYRDSTGEPYYVEKTHHLERFDHVAITLNGQTHIHEAISYLGGIEPTLENLAFGPTNAMHGITAVPSTESTCTTRFTDVGVNDRLFTVWVEYDGTNMYVSYANGDFENAQRPETPQITHQIDLKKYFGEENEGVYMGFTSAIASSKANHTIHAFQFTNEYKPDASYRVEYYFQDSKDSDTYTKRDAETLEVTEIEKDGEIINVQATDVVNDTEYAKKKYVGYTYATVDGKSVNKITVAADGSSVLKLYYNVADTAEYEIKYYKLDPDTGGYVEADTATGEEQKGNVGDTIYLVDVDSDYADKYTDYVVNETKNDKWSVELAEKDETHVLEVYYDPVKTTYTTEYYLQKPDGTYERSETVTSSEVYVGKTVQAETPDYEGYKHVNIPGDSKETATVEAGGATVLKVYYEKIVPGTAKYKVEYYKLDPDTEEYTKTATGTEQTGNVGDIIALTDVDSAYADKYTGYVVNDEMTNKGPVTLTAKGETYVLKVYYDPVKTTYKTEHWVQKPDGTYERKETVTSSEVYVGKTVQAEKKTYEGYKPVNIPGDSKETATVEADGATVLKVYYEKIVPDTAKYKVEYYKLDPDTEEYAKVATGTEQTGNVGDTIALADMDSGYADKYTGDHYVVNTILDTAWSVNLEEEGKTYAIRVYYDPVKTTYKTEYYLKKTDGTLEKTTVKQEAYVGKTVQAEIKTYDGYTHVTTDDSLETAVVTIGGKTVLKVYYEVEEPTEKPSVEDPTEAPSVEEPSENPSEKETGDKTTEPPMTGDTMSYAWLVILLAAAVGGCLVIGKMKKE